MIVSNRTSRADMERIRACTGDFFTDGASLPVSYVIGDKKYRGIPAEFRPRIKKRFVDSNIIERTFTGYDTDSGIEITAECREFLDFPVVEWTLWLENVGEKDSPVVSELYGMDGFLPGNRPQLIHSNGDTNDRNVFTDTVTDLAAAKHFGQTPDGGRGSDCAFPYYRVLCGDFGYTISIGWPGQWTSAFDIADGGFNVTAKQTYTHFYLKPGERVRTPRMTVMTFEGDEDRGVNTWRRWMLAHIVPKRHGQIIRPNNSFSAKDPGAEFENANEKNQLEGIDSVLASGLDLRGMWLDAGWYECTADGVKDWHYTGAFRADHKRFPRGLKPIGDKLRENDMDYIVWCEPERVKLGMLPQAEYGEDFVLKLKDESAKEKMRFVLSSRKLVDDMALFNLGNPEACDWLIEYTDKIIKEYGITIYRQDFNFPPLHYWLQNDTPDRLGMSENRHNQGYLRFWDEIRMRNPDIWINSVSAGGRRHDLESLSRSASLHQTDYGGRMPVTQAVYVHSARWVPYHGAGTTCREDENGDYDYSDANTIPMRTAVDSFLLMNAICPSLQCKVGLNCTALPKGAYADTEECKYYKAFIARVWKRAAPIMLHGDFYVLHMTDRTNTCCHAVQYHDEDADEGFIEAIRNSRCPQETLTVFPHQIDEAKIYVLEEPMIGKTVTVPGAELVRNGFTVSLPIRSGQVWFYHAIKE